MNLRYLLLVFSLTTVATPSLAKSTLATACHQYEGAKVAMNKADEASRRQPANRALQNLREEAIARFRQARSSLLISINDEEAKAVIEAWSKVSNMAAEAASLTYRWIYKARIGESEQNLLAFAAAAGGADQVEHMILHIKCRRR